VLTDLTGDAEAETVMSQNGTAMPDLRLTLACNDYDRCRPLLDGRVKPDGIALDVQRLKPRELFPRMLDHQEFQVGEVSLASYAALVARGESPFQAIPVTLSKIFRHSCIYVRRDAGIAKPEDLHGKRVGTTQYGATAVVYMKGLLRDEYGVAPEDMTWFVGGLTAPTEKPLIPLTLPAAVKLEFLPAGRTLEGMLLEGELDALLSIYFPKIFLDGSPRIVRLFPNFKAVEQDYYRRTRIFPIMHVVVLRNDVVRDHPWVAKAMYRAFTAAKDLALAPLYDTDALAVALPWLLDHVEESRRFFGEDFWAYGIEPNRPALEALCRYVHEQGLAPRRVLPEELFAVVD
jgi:4,5-dihydroxyphthalate decarboxylase